MASGKLWQRHSHVAVPPVTPRPQSPLHSRHRPWTFSVTPWRGDNKTSKELALCGKRVDVNDIMLLCDFLPLFGFVFQILGFYEQLLHRTAQGLFFFGVTWKHLPLERDRERVGPRHSGMKPFFPLQLPRGSSSGHHAHTDWQALPSA